MTPYHSSSHTSPRRINVKVDRFLRILSFQKQQLGNNHGRDPVMDFSIEHDDALFEETGKDVKDPLAPWRGFDDIWNAKGLNGMGRECLSFGQVW